MAFKGTATTSAPERTRETTYEPDFVAAMNVILDPEDPTVGYDFVAADDVLAPVGSEVWVASAKSEAGKVATYLRAKHGEQIKAAGMKVATQYKKSEGVVWVGLMKDDKSPVWVTSDTSDTPESPETEAPQTA
jgi:hypothetical protein